MKFACLGLLLGLSGCVVQAGPTDPASAAAAPAPPPPPGPTAAPAPVAAAPVAAPVAPASAAPTSGFQDTTDPAASDAAKDAKASIADGRPKAYKSGTPESLWIWQDAKGTRWHVRASTMATRHHFQGFVVADGDLKSARATKPEWNDKVKVTGKRASFDWSTDGWSDGMDFDIAGNGCIRFYLLIDGKQQPQRIHLGKEGAHPEKAHFKLCD